MKLTFGFIKLLPKKKYKKMKTLNLNFKQLFTLLFVSIIVCFGNLFYSKNLATDFDKSEFIEQDGIEDSIIISNSENHVVFKGLKNRIDYSNINSKNLKIECENCTVELLKPGELVLVALLSNERTCSLIFKDSVKNIVLDKLQFKIYSLPPPSLLLDGVESGGDINEDNSFELNFSYPGYVLSTSKFEILSFELVANGKIISANGNLKDCKECIDLINTLDKDQKITINCKYTNGKDARYLGGVWVKNF